jgi:hypothetical protein
MYLFFVYILSGIIFACDGVFDQFRNRKAEIGIIGKQESAHTKIGEKIFENVS